MRLADFNNDDFDRGRPRWVEVCWRVVEGLLFNSWLPGSGWRVWLLRRFGATVGEGIVIKPHARVKFPWKLGIGDHSWIGESVWIDNLAQVTIGSNCCISQSAYLCTGSHRWDRDTFDLETKPIVIEDECWVGAMARLAPGVQMRQGAVLTLGSIAAGELREWYVHGGHPAAPLRLRKRAEAQAPD